ncbi:MAG: type III pantothenate kinase [Steroidobacteraceae bacterium]
MNQLLIDAGNTRLKWSALRGARLGRAQALDWNARSMDRVARTVMRTSAERVLVCSVAGLGVERSLRRAARAAGKRPPQFVRSTRHAAGVRNGYLETWRLGADRWVAMLGARALHPARALCIVDVGTALTIDLVDSLGRHRGGLIVPGPTLMVDSLLNDTAGIRVRAGSNVRASRRGGGLFGRSTRAGLLGGSTMACAALIERALSEARRELQARPLLLLSGGGAAQVAALLSAPHRRVDGLVLHGLGLLARLEYR